MRFSTLAKISKPDNVISRRYEEWAKNNGNPKYSDKALEFATKALSDQGHPRKRAGTISASSLGKCMRQQQFTFLGMPKKPIEAKTGSIFVNGTFMHIRWQMAGLTEGWLQEAEVPVPADNPYRLSGTMDGIADDGSVVEFKSCNDRSFAQVMSFGPLSGHETQGGAYLLATGRERVIFLYENKNDQSFTEIVKTRADLQLDALADKIKTLWAYTDEKILIEPLEEIYEKKSPCSWCPYLDVCSPVKSWDQAETIAKEKK